MKPPVAPFPAFGMSLKRAALLRTCARAYFWDVYGSHNGHDVELDNGVNREAWLLARSPTLRDLVEDLIQGVVEDVVVDRFLFKESTIKAAKRFDDVTARALRGETPTLLEVLYPRAPLSALVDRARVALADAMELLRRHRLYGDAWRTPEELVNMRDRGLLPFVPGDGMQPLLLDEAPRVVVLRGYEGRQRCVGMEWTTTSAVITPERLGLFAAWALAQGLVRDPSDVVMIRVNVLTMASMSEAASFLHVALGQDDFRAAIGEAVALIVDGDVERNEPRPMEAFAQVQVGSEACRFCQFRRLCGRE